MGQKWRFSEEVKKDHSKILSFIKKYIRNCKNTFDFQKTLSKTRNLHSIAKIQNQ